MEEEEKEWGEDVWEIHGEYFFVGERRRFLFVVRTHSHLEWVIGKISIVITCFLNYMVGRVHESLHVFLLVVLTWIFLT